MVATRASGTNAVRYGTIARTRWASRSCWRTGASSTRRPHAQGRQRLRPHALFIGSEGTLGIVTKVRLRCTASGSMSSAVVQFATLRGAVQSVIQVMQMGIPVRGSTAVTRHDGARSALTKLEGYTGADHALPRIHGSEAGVAEQAAWCGGDHRRAWRRGLSVGDRRPADAQQALEGAA
jgi:D-lactate dehydrogenase (cytochrome)